MTTGLFGKRNLQPRGFVTGRTSCTYRLTHAAAVSVSNVKMRFPAWTTQAAGTGDTATGNTVNVKAYVEYGGTAYPVTFGGSSTYAITSGSYVDSDAVSGLTITAGSTLDVRTYVSVASGGQWPNLYGSYIYPDEVARPGSDLSNGTGDLTGTGQAFADLYGPTQIWGDLAAGQSQYAVTIFGDSIVAGVNDDFSAPADTGYWQRALYPGSRPFSFVALPGESASQFNSSQATNRYGIIGENVDYVVNEYGINDLQGGATLAQLQARVLSVMSNAGASSVTGRFQQTLGPKSSSTDSWATTTNQTTDGINTIRVQFNNWVRDGMPISGGVAVATGTVGATRAGGTGHPFTGYIEVADLCESSRDSGIWKANYTTDGLHPGPSGNAAIAAALDLSQFANLAPAGGSISASIPKLTGSISGTVTAPATLARAASSPAMRTSAFQGSSNSQAWASNSFSPPAGSVLVVTGFATQAFNNAWNTPTITDSLATHLTWTRVDTQANVTFSGVAATVSVFWASCPSAQTGMTVTVTQSCATGQSITFSAVAVDVLTGADTTAPIGTVVKGYTTTDPFSASLAPAGGNSASFVAGANAGAGGAATTAISGEYLLEESHTSTSYARAWWGTSSGPTVPAGTQSLGLDGAGTPRWQYIAYEAKGAAVTITGATSAAIPNLTGSISGSVTTTGAPSASLPVITGSIAGASLTTGLVSAAIPNLTGSVSGIVTVTGSVSAALPLVTGSASGVLLTVGAITTSLPVITGAVSGALLTAGSVAGSLPNLTGSISGTLIAPTTGTVAATLPTLTGSLSGALLTAGSVSAALPVLTGSLSGISYAPTTGAVSAALPVITGALSGVSYAPTTGGVAASLPLVAGSLSGVSYTVGALVGNLPLITGALAGSSLTPVTGTIVGSLPLLACTSTGAIVVVGAVGGSLRMIVAHLGDNAGPLFVLHPRLVLGIPTSSLDLDMHGFTQNDTAPPLSGQLVSDTLGSLSGASAAVHVLCPDASLISRTATLAQDGSWSLPLQAGDLAHTGRYLVEVEVTFSGGSHQTFPGGVFYVGPELA